MDTQTITFVEFENFPNHPNCENGWSEDYAKLLINKALEEIEHHSDITNVVITKYVCRAIDETNLSTEVCYVETEQPGFFYIMRDMVASVNVVYNRWD
ncbi:hypothetical protein [Seonamhaeicola marinus]|uniref:Uncharacterized protein n=1 Tax=Seonamhaeicola marinus TaxID=1912246 RepID=A0A5D0HSA8_9FLAO|nr:hypothetical protein [Seonamhaeicola marinus]TYA74226.1 hypothetical protein FUA24_12905 [Seonamhaeicola marinus]